MIKLIIQLVTVCLIAAIFFGFTDPSNLPVALLMIPVILIFILIYLFVRIVLKLLATGLVSASKQRTYALLSGLAASLIMLFQSTGGIVWADIILMSIFMVVAYFYINKL